MPLRAVVGHRQLLQLIARAVSRSSLPSSLVFSGPDGVGKRLVAVTLAQLLNCPARSQVVDGQAAAERAFALDACGVCPVCDRIARGAFPDVLVLPPGNNGSITIEPVRAAIDQAAYRPFEGRRRVMIIDQADRLMVQAQNALLKTLEETPASSQFVLVTARPDMLLPTVRSRCPELRFGRLAASDVAGALMAVHGYDERDARSAAAVADGSLGRALEVASGAVVQTREAATRVLRAVATARDGRARLEAAKELTGPKTRGRASAGDRSELARRLRVLASLVRDLELLASRADHRLLANADLEGGLLDMSEAFDRERCVHAFSAVGRALDAVERNASPKVVADWLACSL